MLYRNLYNSCMRYQYIDILRGLMILLMIVFHLNYSLVNIFESEIINFSETFWYILGKISALGFMTIAGVSYFLAEEKYTEQELHVKYFKYACVLAAISLTITAITYILIPEQLIVFGILHFFALSFVLLPFITKIRYGAIITLVFIVLVSYIWNYRVELGYLFPLWFYNSDFSSADYYPLIPYFWYILWGYIAAVMWDKYNILHIFHAQRKLSFPEEILTYLWKRSLLVYLIHQPIIIWIIWAVTYFQ